MSINLLDFGVEVIVISASGVLAPGPLFFTSLLYGSRQGAHAGIKMAYGHTVVELPLIVLLAAGLFSSTLASRYAGLMGLVGGIGILVFAALQVACALKKDMRQKHPAVASKKGPFLAGVALTALNPFFLLWWFAVGLKLIADSQAFGFLYGIALLFVLHVWMDFAWLTATAQFAARGSSALKSKYYQLLLLGLAAILIYYGIYFIASSVMELS
jgi:threonine/homoserine/homoserine lactone efflux protein